MSAAKPPVSGQIFVVVVLYKILAEESAAFRSIASCRARLGEAKSLIKVLCFDNTPQQTGSTTLHEGSHREVTNDVVFIKAGRNIGLAGAYNTALRAAREEGFPWLLTLDQDTTLPDTFFEDMLRHTEELGHDRSVAAIVPQLYDRMRLLSPNRVYPWRNKLLPPGFTGFAKGEVNALNSGSLFRVQALEEIGGFNEEFWLDFLDMWVYRSLYQRRKKIYVAGEIQLQHELSLTDFPTRVSADRFANILNAECAFVDLYGGVLTNAFYTARVCARAYSVHKRKRSKEIQETVWGLLRRRLFWTKKRRLNFWAEEVEARKVSSS